MDCFDTFLGSAAMGGSNPNEIWKPIPFIKISSALTTKWSGALSISPPFMIVQAYTHTSGRFQLVLISNAAHMLNITPGIQSSVQLSIGLNGAWVEVAPVNSTSSIAPEYFNQLMGIYPVK